MKKLNYLMLGLAGLMMASCSQDDLQAPGQADGNYIVTVKLPSNLGTRAVNMNTGYTANDLYYAVYDAVDGSLVQTNKTTFTEAAGGALETQVGLNLASGKSYKISFFACAPNNNVYTFDANAKTMTVNYEAMTSAGTEENDIYDCFINLLETNEIGSGQMQSSVTLYRPIAQINWGTSDLDEPSIQKAYGVNGQYILSNLSTDAYYTWDLLANDVDMTAGKKKVEYKEPFSQPQNATGLAPFPVTGYKYVAMQYVLAPKTEAIYDLNLNINNEGEGNPDPTTLTSDVEVSSAPVQANFQTNIYGSLLTDNVVVNVVKSPAWYTPSYNVENTGDFINALATGGTVTLFGDVYLPATATITNNVTIDLNGYNLYWTDAKDGGLVVGQGGNLTIKGNGNIIDYYPEDNYQTLVFVQGGTLNIEGGNFTGYGAGQLVYVETGVANISGGKFALLEDTSGDNWCLNCKDANYKNQTAQINVTGGTFINWNPGDNNAEGDGTSYLAPGYKVISQADGEDTAYIVVKDNTVEATTPAQLEEAVADGNDVFMQDNITISQTNQNSGYGGAGVAIKNGLTFDGNNKTLSVPGANTTWASAISTTGGIIKNLTINKGFRGIFICHNSSYNAPVILENVILDGVTYTISCDQGSNQGLTATNCTFNGWTSYAATLGNTSFINCNFGKGNGYAFMRPYAPTVLKGCSFAAGFTIDAQASMTFENCTFNGAPLTSENLDQLVTSNTQNATVK